MALVWLEMVRSSPVFHIFRNSVLLYPSYFFSMVHKAGKNVRDSELVRSNR